MGYYQDMLERRRKIAGDLYRVVEPRLEHLARTDIVIEDNLDITIRDLMAMTKYAMELDMEVAQLCREDSIDEDYGTSEERYAEAERLLRAISCKSAAARESRSTNELDGVCDTDEA